MQVVVEGGRLYYPPEDPNKPDERDVFHPETNTEQVLAENGQNLEEYLKGTTIVVSSKKPDRKCIWGKVMDVRTTSESDD